jgi:cell division protein FtsZ
MMGTGEAEGEKRASDAADQALKNPLIDEYSLQGARGLLVNITGGKDLTLFEVDEAVNKVRAEVDSEAELIIGAITDSTLDGKMRVSIVATALDNQGPQTKPVVSMVHKIHNRNLGYSDNSPKASVFNQSTINATEGATALDINVAEIKESKIEKEQTQTNENSLENISIENATYLQNVENGHDNVEEMSRSNDELPNFEVDSIELANPQSISNDKETDFSDRKNNNEEGPEVYENQDVKEDHITKEPELFENSESEENFEIPAFLRRQKN